MGFFSGRHHPAPQPGGPRLDELEQFLETAQHFHGVRPDDGVAVPIVLRKDEHMLVTMTGALLVEPRRQAGHWEGASHGLSVRVPARGRCATGSAATRGTFVQGAEVPSPIDEGDFTVTDQRAVFVGAKRTREWSWAKLISVQHQTDAPWTAIAVSNRQKTSGVAYDADHADLIRFWIDLAVSRATGTDDELIATIESEIAALRPPPPSA